MRSEAKEHFTSTAGQARVPTRFIEELEVPVPPVAEQRRIVAKLEQLLGIVDACQQRLAKVPALLKRFRQSVLAAGCSGWLTADWREQRGQSVELDWREETLSGICTVITDGDHQPPPKEASGIPFLTIGDISTGQLDFADTRFVSERYFQQIKPERKPVRGDVLYTVVATIGVPVLVDTDRKFCFQRHIALLRASEATTPAFLRLLLESPQVVHQARARATGTAQPTCSLSSLRLISISLPSPSEQEEIVRRVEAFLALAHTIKCKCSRAQAQVDRLTASLLTKAFCGELVPTEAELARQEGRDYEPASVLLERLQQERDGDVARSSKASIGANRRRRGAHATGRAAMSR